MRVTIGQRGILAKDLPTLGGDTIPAGVEIEIWKQHSPKRVWIKEYPSRFFLDCGRSFLPVDRDAYNEAMKSTPTGNIEDWPAYTQLPSNQAWPVCLVKASKIWFEVEEGEEWKS
jgi:hypothetical protein